MPTDALEATKSVVQVVAIVVAGCWALWTFQRLQRTRAAEVDVRAKEVDIKAKEADIVTKAATVQESERRRLSEQPNLSIAFKEVVQCSRPEAGGTFLAVTVELSNPGTRNLQVDLDASTVMSARYDLSDPHLTRMLDVFASGSRQLEPDAELSGVSYKIIRVGQRRDLAFLVRAPHPGIYLLQFRAIYSLRQFDEEPSLGRGTRIVAVQQRIVEVTGARDASPGGPAREP